MKNKKLSKVLASVTLCIMVFSMLFVFAGCDETTDVNVRVDGGFVQWQISGDSTWNNLISIDEVADLLSDSLQGNPGINGREVEFRKTDSSIQWRYADNNQSSDDNWKDLIALSELKVYGSTPSIGTNGNWWIGDEDTGVKALAVDGQTPTISISSDGYWVINDEKTEHRAIGTNGTSYYVHIKYCSETPSSSATLTDTPSNWIGIYSGTSQYAPASFTQYNWYQLKEERETCQVSYDYNLPEIFQSYYIEYTNFSTSVIKGDCLDLPEFDEYLSRYFLGWSTGTTQNDIKYSNYTPVYRDLTLFAMWDTAKLQEDMQKSGSCIKMYFDRTKNIVIVCNNDIIVPDEYELCHTYAGVIIWVDDLYIPAFARYSGKYYPVTTISGTSFDDAPIKTLHIPATIDFVGPAFARCNNLTKVTISDGAKLIGQNAFVACPALKSIYIPNSVTVDNVGNVFHENTVIYHENNASLLALTNRYNIVSFVSYIEYLIYQQSINN